LIINVTRKRDIQKLKLGAPLQHAAQKIEFYQEYPTSDTIIKCAMLSTDLTLFDCIKHISNCHLSAMFGLAAKPSP